MKRVIATAVLLHSFSVHAFAQETPGDLAKKLGSPTFLERESAAKKLEKLGAAALPALRDSFTSADLETKRRALAVMERIEERILKDEIVRPTPLRIRMDDTPLEISLRLVEKQTGLTLGGVDPNPALTLDTGELPFWQAWHAYAKAAKLHEGDPTRWSAKLKSINEEEATRILELYRTGRLDRRTTLEMPRVQFADKPDGVFAVDDRHSVRVRVKWQALESERAVFAFEVRPEPRFKLVAPPRVEVGRIIDVDGKERPVEWIKQYPDAFADGADFLAMHAGEMQFGGHIHLKSLAWKGPAITLKELHGQVRMEVKVAAPLIAIPKVLEASGNKPVSFDGVKLTVVKAARVKQQIQLRVLLENVELLTPANEPPQAVRVRPGVIGIRGPMDVAMTRLELRGSLGRHFPHIDAWYHVVADNKGYFATLIFEPPADAGDDLTLVLTKAPRNVTVEVPFLVREVGVALAPKE